MAIVLADWLLQMSARFGKPADDFAFYVFRGTQAELESRLTAWTRPNQAEIIWFDAATRVTNYETTREAAAGVEAELSQLARKPGKLLIVIAGMNVLAGLFHDQLLVPVFKHLRRSNRVVVAVVPPEAPKKLPPRVRLDDWRGALAREVGVEQVVIPTGGQV